MSAQTLSKQAILDRLAHQDSDLENFHIDINRSEITLTFSYQCIPESRIIILLEQVIYFNFSKDMSEKDEGFCYVIMEAVLKKLATENKDILDKIGYGFSYTKDDITKMLATDLYHIHIEGEIIADIIFRHFSILTPVTD